jgi:hypothetical protein
LFHSTPHTSVSKTNFRFLHLICSYLYANLDLIAICLPVCKSLTLRPQSSSVHTHIVNRRANYKGQAASEMYPDGFSDPATSKAFDFDFKCLDSATSGLVKKPKSFTIRSLLNFHVPTNEGKFRALYTWIRLIGNYSRRNITKLQDKLVAISGVAKYLQASIQADYLAGLWNTDSPLQLMWRVPVTSEPQAARVPVFVAPTWSWASIHGAIDIEEQISNSLVSSFMIDILEVNIVLKTGDKFGDILSGKLKLRGWLRSFELHGSDTNYWYFKYQGDYARIFCDNKQVENEGEWCCLPILGRRTEGSAGKSFGLMLDSTGSSPYEYRRVGIFWATGYSKKPSAGRNIEGNLL